MSYYDFNKEARIVCEAIGSEVGNMTVECALREAFAAGYVAGRLEERAVVDEDLPDEWCHAESPLERPDDDPYVCTLPLGHSGSHIAEDIYGAIKSVWPQEEERG